MACTFPPSLASALRFLALCEGFPQLDVHVCTPEHADEEANEATVCAHDCEEPPDKREAPHVILVASRPEHREASREHAFILQHVTREIRHHERH